jgi:hypothetical protein
MVFLFFATYSFCQITLVFTAKRDEKKKKFLCFIFFYAFVHKKKWLSAKKQNAICLLFL